MARCGGDGNAERGDEGFFGQPVLRDGERIGAGPQRLQRREEVGGGGRDVLELVGDDVDRGGEGGEGGLVVIGGDGLVRRDLEGGALRVGAVDVGAKPSRAAASASMRPSWPPPRMPMVAPSGSGVIHRWGNSATRPVCSWRQAVERGRRAGRR